MKYLNKFLELNDLEILDQEKYQEFLEIKGAEKYIETLEVEKLDLEELKEMIELNKYLITQSYYSYFKFTFPDNNPLIRGRHIELICDILTLATKGIIKTDNDANRFNLLVDMPPRHLKSTSITNTFPSWFILKTQTPVIITAYGDSLAKKAGASNRDLYIRHKKYFGNIGLKATAQDIWVTDRDARVIASPIQGKVTGEGANLLIIDDPVKNRLEANSATYRERIKQAWEDDLSTRRNPGEITITILLMTRWHEEDLAGILSESKAEKFAKLILPAECEDEEIDILNRKKDEPLWPECGFDNNYFKPYKENPRTWASLFQQRPSIEDGENFKREYFKYADKDINFYYLYDDGETISYKISDCFHFFTIDTAMKDKQENDETAITFWALTPKYDLVLLDVEHRRLEIPEQQKLIINKIMEYQPDIIYIEDKQSGTYHIQELKKLRYQVEELQAISDKILRAEAAIQMYASGYIYHLKNCRNVRDLEKQLCEFPNAKHDDMVDCVSYAGKVAQKYKHPQGSHFMMLR